MDANAVKPSIYIIPQCFAKLTEVLLQEILALMATRVFSTRAALSISLPCLVQASIWALRALVIAAGGVKQIPCALPGLMLQVSFQSSYAYTAQPFHAPASAHRCPANELNSTARPLVFQVIEGRSRELAPGMRQDGLQQA